MEEEKPMEKTQIVNKAFHYAKGGTNLNFTLRIDNSSELRPFKECLDQAIKDVEAEIALLKN